MAALKYKYSQAGLTLGGRHDPFLEEATLSNPIGTTLAEHGAFGGFTSLCSYRYGPQKI